ncbi:hypothetical protein JKP88DRAFT_303608 [Tribonema minus]|uniref:Uncharacterized protein n=1 Tax=Tribonema minus TaxID=303371 RepID=A0A836CJU9_9STRA|nr:hypothetical protein JKP88DRAFT_303608 [Tribonema minus]
MLGIGSTSSQQSAGSSQQLPDPPSPLTLNLDGVNAVAAAAPPKAPSRSGSPTGRSSVPTGSPLQCSPGGGSMLTPGLSRGKDQETIMQKQFGVSMEQMKRTQALLRLGVTEDDLKVAERLFAELPGGEELRKARAEGVISPAIPRKLSKEERLLGLTKSEISFCKALEVLGVDMAIVEEERARRLGQLGQQRSSDAIGDVISDDDSSESVLRRRALLPSPAPRAPTPSAAATAAVTAATAVEHSERLLAAAAASLQRVRDLEAVCTEQQRTIKHQEEIIESLRNALRGASMGSAYSECDDGASAFEHTPSELPSMEEAAAIEEENAPPAARASG